MRVVRWVGCVSILFIVLFTPFSVHAQSGSAVTEAQVKKAIEELEKLAPHEIDTNAVPGLAIAIVFQDKVVYAKGFGVRDTRTNEKIDADTVFQIASVSKPVGSTVVAALVGDGKITWDSKINDLDLTFEMYDPWVTREVTLRDMYAHRSGLPDHVGDLLEDLGYSRAEILHRLRFQKPSSSFRTHFAYTNFGMTAAGVAAAMANGLEWEDASSEKLYTRLGMNSTSSRFQDFDARTNKAVNHVLVDGEWVHKFQRKPDAQSPAGGASSSVNDMAKWIRLQLGNGKFEDKQIVAEEALLETRKPHMLLSFNPFTGLPGFYGLGWNVGYDQQGHLRLNHSGGFALGAATYVNIVLGEQLGVIVLSNGYPSGLVEGLGQTFIETALYGKPTQDWLAVFKQLYSNPEAVGVEVNTAYPMLLSAQEPALENSTYVGTYKNDFFGEIVVEEKNGGLMLTLGPDRMMFPMKYFERDIFTYETVGENASGVSGLYFAIGADRKATGVRVEALDVYGSGTFTRVIENKP